MTDAIDFRSRKLLIEAAEWRLLSLLFDCPGPAWRVQIADLSKEVTDPALQACTRLALEQAAEGLYYSTFGPGGPASPREVSYCDTLQYGYLMSELETYYDAFGFHPLTKEAPDHVAVETGFLAYLKMKEAFALASGDEQHKAVTGQAAAQFVAEHLSRIAEPLAERLAPSGLGYLAEAALALQERAGEPPSRRRPSAVEDLRVLPEDSVFSCGTLGSLDELELDH